MTDRRVGDTNLPYNPDIEQKKEDTVDPEKFKKILKVGESDESQKRQKRRLKKEEEEGEDEELTAAPSPPPTDHFSTLMQDKEGPDSILASESAGKRHRQVPTSSSPYEPSSQPTSEEEEEEPPTTPSPSPSEFEEEGFANTSQESTEPSQETLAPQEEFQVPTSPMEEDELDTFPESSLPPMQEQEIDEAVATPTSSEQEGTVQPPTEPEKQQKDLEEKKPAKSTKKPKKKKTADVSLLASQTKKGALAPKKKKKEKKPAIIDVAKKEPPKSSKEPTLEKPSLALDETKAQPKKAPPTEDKKEAKVQPKEAPPTEDKKEAKAQPKEEALVTGAPSPQAPPKAEEEPAAPLTGLPPKTERSTLTFRRFTVEEERAKSKRVTAPEKGEEPAHAKKHKRSDQEGLFIEASKDNAAPLLPALIETLPTVQPTQGVSYSKLSDQMYDLFEKMGGVMMIQNKAGITTTTMTLNMPDSVFNNAQIVVDQYSTAPHAFNIQLIGSPQAVEAFTKNIPKLSQAFKEANYDFEVNILSPTLQTKGKKPLIRRKKSAGDQGGSGGRK